MFEAGEFTSQGDILPLRLKMLSRAVMKGLWLSDRGGHLVTVTSEFSRFTTIGRFGVLFLTRFDLYLSLVLFFVIIKDSIRLLVY